MRSFRFTGAFVLSCTAALWAGTATAKMPLSSVPVASTYSLDPATSGAPTSSAVRLPDGESRPALRFADQGRTSYDIPEGMNCFTGVLLFGAPEPASGRGGNQIEVRFILDGRTAFERILGSTTPPERFEIPLAGARRLTIATDELISGGFTYLADGEFSSRTISATASNYLLELNTGYLSPTSNVRQQVLHTYHPRENVPLKFEFNGSADRAQLKITLSPDNGTPAQMALLTVPLRGGSGSANWQVPELLGPAILEMTAAIDARQVFVQSQHVAISRQADVSRMPASSPFGIHASSAGFSYLTDNSAAEVWGAKWARVFLRWEIVEYQKGRYDWQRADEIINNYLNQHMEVLAVLGEGAPRWEQTSGAATEADFLRFAQAAVEHFQNRVRYWDVYNEVDSKVYNGVVIPKDDPGAGIQLLGGEMQAIRRVQPNAVLICCSTGTSEWLAYDQRLYEGKLLPMMDAVSLHPYESRAPELKSGAFNYLESIDALRRLEQAYGATKPVWSTEANWLIGPPGAKGVTAPEVSDHEQSAYLVRVNLLSMAAGVPYFAHSPFFYPFHRQPLVDSIASYANMTYEFGRAGSAKLLNIPNGIFGVSAKADCGDLLALWTIRKTASVRISGLADMQTYDFYGNRLKSNPASVSLTGDPIYVCGAGDADVTVLSAAPAPPSRSLPDITQWKGALQQTHAIAGKQVNVTSTPTKYGRLLASPIQSLQPNACYVVTMKINLHRGGVTMLGVDPDSGAALGPAAYLFAVNGDDQYEPEIRVRTADDGRLQVLLTGANVKTLSVSQFEASDPTIAACGE